MNMQLNSRLCAVFSWYFVYSEYPLSRRDAKNR